MKAYEIIWIESNDYRILKTMHETLYLMYLFKIFLKIFFCFKIT